MVRCCKGCTGFLIGPDEEQPLIGIYSFYPLLCVIRLVKITFALLHFYFTTGTVPYQDLFLTTLYNITLETVLWSSYILSYFIIFTSTYLSRIASVLTKPLALFAMDYDRGPTCRQALRRTRNVEHDIVFAFDVRYMVLTCYCCYPWWNVFLTSSAYWYASFFKSIDNVESKICAPSSWLVKRLIR